MLMAKPEVGMVVTFDRGLPTESKGQILSIGMDSVKLLPKTGAPFYVALSRLDPATFFTTNR